MSRRRRDDDDLSPEDREWLRSIPDSPHPFHLQIEPLLDALEAATPAHSRHCMCHQCGSHALVVLAWNALREDHEGQQQWPHATLLSGLSWGNELLKVLYRLRRATEKHREECPCLQCTAGAVLGRAWMHLHALAEEQGVPDAS